MRPCFLVPTLLLAACATTTDDQAADVFDGKLDGSSAAPVRTLTLAIDRRPVDGPLVQLHVEPLGPWSSRITVETTIRSRAGESHRREVLIENGECAVGLDEILCNEDPEVADRVFEAVRRSDGWTATTQPGDDEAALATRLQATHLRFSRHAGHPDGAIELTVETTSAGQVVTLRRASTTEPEVVMHAAGCKLAADALTCVEDGDDGYATLTLTRIVPGGPYRATLHTTEPTDTTAILADELVLR